MFRLYIDCSSDVGYASVGICEERQERQERQEKEVTEGGGGGVFVPTPRHRRPASLGLGLIALLPPLRRQSST